MSTSFGVFPTMRSHPIAARSPFGVPSPLAWTFQDPLGQLGFRQPLADHRPSPEGFPPGRFDRVEKPLRVEEREARRRCRAPCGSRASELPPPRQNAHQSPSGHPADHHVREERLHRRRRDRYRPPGARPKLTDCTFLVRVLQHALFAPRSPQLVRTSRARALSFREELEEAIGHLVRVVGEEVLQELLRRSNAPLPGAAELFDCEAEFRNSCAEIVRRTLVHGGTFRQGS